MPDHSSRISLWGVEVFLATADEGAVSAAARRLGASPSAVSQQISALESALNCILIDRSSRPVGLTPAGRIFLPRARAILAQSDQARAELTAQDMSALTLLRLGVIEDFDATVTPHLLAGLAGDLPSCRFVLETGPSHRLFDLLDTRALDMVVATDLGPAADWMDVHPLVREPFIAAVPVGAVDPRGDVLAQLQAMPLIQYTRRHHIGRQISDHLVRQNLTLSHRFELDSYNAIMAMVAQGAGWTILTPMGVLHAHRFRKQAEILPLPFAPLTRTISVSARAAGGMHEMPAQVAARLRSILQREVIDPTVDRLPWLAGDLALI